MTPEEETLEKIKYVLSFGNDAQAIRLIEHYGHYKQEQTKQCAINDVAKSDSEQLRGKKVKDLVNLAKSELSNYNKQKVLKAETEEGRQITKLLKKIIDLENH